MTVDVFRGKTNVPRQKNNFGYPQQTRLAAVASYLVHTACSFPTPTRWHWKRSMFVTAAGDDGE